MKTEFLLFFGILLTLFFFFFFFFKKQKDQGNNDQLAGDLKKELQTEFQNNRLELNQLLTNFRQEQFNSFKQINDLLNSRLNDFSKNLEKNIKELIKTQNELGTVSENRLDKIRSSVEKNLERIQNDNNKKLEEMRLTVDEKLHHTLEKRLGDSFKQVSQRLELVHQGLGEMQTLASGVGDLKKVLANVKVRGTFGEYQLENILAQLLTEEQFKKNVKTKKGSSNHVEFAVKLPANKGDDTITWLPIDSKFPISEYESLIDASNNCDKEALKKAEAQLVRSIKNFAKDIRDKYLDPPHTTEFAIMFLPIEGLYAEVVKNVELFHILQTQYRITVAGPTTLSAFLNSLQMGFRTLAIEKRSSEVWQILGATKTEFKKFGDVLEKAEKKLNEAQDVLVQSRTRTRAIERKLKDVEILPQNDLSEC